MPGAYNIRGASAATTASIGSRAWLDAERRRQDAERERARQEDLTTAAHNSARANVLSAAQNNSNVAMSYRDPATGLAMEYSGAGGAPSYGSPRASSASAYSGAGGAETAPPPSTSRVSLTELLRDSDRVTGEAPARVRGASRVDRTAANDSAFARAKDKIGLSARASLNSLRNLMTERGIAGSGIEGALMANVLNEGQGQIGDTVREQTIQDLAREQSVEDRNYQGDVTQRGQDLSRAEQRRAAIQALFSMRGPNAVLY